MVLPPLNKADILMRLIRIRKEGVTGWIRQRLPRGCAIESCDPVDHGVMGLPRHRNLASTMQMKQLSHSE